ncbi:F-box/WD repeat-containing protein 7 isoform X1 [Xenopus tropicalis]|uniref:F-box/WD repeat-containing protein 7 isoform X1 n=1 Tax=Xenopus tropicalis TaxID=8364 RepID=A0A8J0SZV3_XENTR|nr:F-box/WD repeat-containing protein 7 isoform X1 [Xenopus tropicalis]
MGCARQSRMEAGEPQDCTSWLPDELALRILSYLDAKDILQVAQTCQRWRELAEDEGLWQGKCKADGIEEPLHISTATGSRPRPWKSTYTNQLRVDTNWHRGRFRTITLDLLRDYLDLHRVGFNGKELVCTIHYEIIKVWSAVTGECPRTLVGDRASVTAVQMRDHMIVSGYEDGTVKVWNAESGECIHTLGGHTSHIHNVHLHEQRAASCSSDRTIRVWDIEAGQCLHTLLGHEASVMWVWYNGRRLVSEDLCHIVKMWDPETETCLRSVCLHSGAFITFVQFDGKHIVSLLCPGRTIGVWDGATLERTRTITGNEPYTTLMTLKNSILGVVNSGRAAEIWNVETGQRLNLLQDPDGFDPYAHDLALRGDFLIGRTGTGRVTLWDWRTGQFLQNLFVPKREETLAPHLLVSNTKLVFSVASKWGALAYWPHKVLVLDFDVKERAKKKNPFSVLSWVIPS